MGANYSDGSSVPPISRGHSNSASRSNLLTGMKKVIFHVNNFFGYRHFFDPWYVKKDPKRAGTKIFLVSKNQFFEAQRNFWNMYCIFKLFSMSFKWLPVIQFWELMSKNEISRTISCIYFMKIWVDLGFESSEVSLIYKYLLTLETF